MIEHVGDYVRINGRMIPAVNIQVENVPGYIDIGRGRTFWYGVYFEIGFEDGSLWIVNYGDEEATYLDGYSCIKVCEYARFAYDPDACWTSWFVVLDWDDFLNQFLKKVESISA